MHRESFGREISKTQFEDFDFKFGVQNTEKNKALVI